MQTSSRVYAVGTALVLVGAMLGGFGFPNGFWLGAVILGTLTLSVGKVVTWCEEAPEMGGVGMADPFRREGYRLVMLSGGAYDEYGVLDLVWMPEGSPSPAELAEAFKSTERTSYEDRWGRREHFAEWIVETAGLERFQATEVHLGTGDGLSITERPVRADN